MPCCIQHRLGTALGGRDPLALLQRLACAMPCAANGCMRGYKLLTSQPVLPDTSIGYLRNRLRREFEGPLLVEPLTPRAMLTLNCQ